MNLLLLVLVGTFSAGEFSNIKIRSSVVPRIIGGEEAYVGQFPWAAAIYKTTADGNYFCGGSLLSTDWILTAGQCVDGALLFTIILGTNYLNGDENAVRVATETYVLHPDYNPETLEYDLGLIKLRLPLTFNFYLRQTFLPYQETNPGEWVVAFGWGQMSDSESGISNDLHLARMTALSNEECKIYYGDQIKDNMVCAAGQYNEGPCYGDIGGALMWQYRGGYFPGGVTSFISSNGCESLNPSGYTRVYPFNDWIRNVTGIE